MHIKSAIFPGAIMIVRTKHLRMSGRVGLAALLYALVLALPGQAQQRRVNSEWQPGGRRDAYLHDIFGTGALVSTAASSAIDQISNDPEEWGDGADGFLKRVASNAGRRVVQESVRHGLAAAMDRSVQYERCTCTDAGARLGHVLVETVTDRDEAGHRMIAIPRFAGAYAGAFAEHIWRPNETGVEIFTTGLSAIVFGAVGNFSKEFLHIGF
jgi:hypothetical protein